MHNLGPKSSFVAIMLLTAFVSFAAIALPAQARPIATAVENVIVIGNKQRYLWGSDGYLFMHNTSMSFEALEIANWTFDHIEVDFGCHVGGVTGENVSQIFSISSGRIQECRPG